MAFICVECCAASPLTVAEMVLLFVVVKMSLLLVVDAVLMPNAGFSIDLRALLKFNGGKKAGNENPAAAAACSDCSKAAECSCALRRSSATDVVRGSLADDVDTFVSADERLALNDEIDDVVDDVIVGQHEHKPGNPKSQNIYFNLIPYYCQCCLLLTVG